MSEIDRLGDAIREVFSSPNVADSNFEMANIVDVLDRLSSAMFALAKAIEATELERGFR